MTGAFVAATVVAVLQYIRVRDARVLLLAAMLLLQAVSLSLDWASAWKSVSQGAVCLAGLALVLALGARHPPFPQPPPPEPHEPPPARETPPRGESGERDRLSS
jgi:hypothetical protein